MSLCVLCDMCVPLCSAVCVCSAVCMSLCVLFPCVCVAICMNMRVPVCCAVCVSLCVLCSMLVLVCCVPVCVCVCLMQYVCPCVCVAICINMHVPVCCAVYTTDCAPTRGVFTFLLLSMCVLCREGKQEAGSLPLHLQQNLGQDIGLVLTFGCCFVNYHGGLFRGIIYSLILLGGAPCQVITGLVKLAGLSNKSIFNLCVALLIYLH